MNMQFSLAVATILALGLASAPTLADGNKGKPQKQSGGSHTSWNCPPGLAKKNPPCVPLGQAKKYGGLPQHPGYGYRLGDILQVRDLVLIRDPWRYGLDDGPGWNYYRDDERIYRTDGSTQQILAVLDLIDAFSD